MLYHQQRYIIESKYDYKSSNAEDEADFKFFSSIRGRGLYYAFNHFFVDKKKLRSDARPSLMPLDKLGESGILLPNDYVLRNQIFFVSYENTNFKSLINNASGLFEEDVIFCPFINFFYETTTKGNIVINEKRLDAMLDIDRWVHKGKMLESSLHGSDNMPNVEYLPKDSDFAENLINTDHKSTIKKARKIWMEFLKKHKNFFYDNVKVTKVNEFRGMDANYIFYTDYTQATKKKQLYLGMSRAKAKLYMYAHKSLKSKINELTDV